MCKFCENRLIRSGEISRRISALIKARLVACIKRIQRILCAPFLFFFTKFENFHIYGLQYRLLSICYSISNYNAFHYTKVLVILFLIAVCFIIKPKVGDNELAVDQASQEHLSKIQNYLF